SRTSPLCAATRKRSATMTATKSMMACGLSQKGSSRSLGSVAIARLLAGGALPVNRRGQPVPRRYNGRQSAGVLRLPRYKLTIEYDGKPFCGWQRQADLMSVQQALEEALERFSGERITTQAAGRTDAGVHAFAQVVHFDLDTPRDTFRIREALNYHLKPHPIAVLRAEHVPDDF